MLGLTQPDSNPVGTSDYMSPELARIDPNITPASDIYSLGVTVFHALAGRLPFVADNQYVIAHKHANETPPDLRALQPTISPEVSRVVMRTLAKDPSKRYPSAGAFANAFTEAVMQSQSAPIPTPAVSVSPRKIAAIVGGVLAVLILIGGAIFVVNRARPSQQPTGNATAAATVANAVANTDVPPTHADTVRSFQPELQKMGFMLEEFGPHTFALKEWPAVLPETKQAKRFLEEVLEAFQTERPTSQTAIQHQIAARAACRAAIMAGDSISGPEYLGRDQRSPCPGSQTRRLCRPAQCRCRRR